MKNIIVCVNCYVFKSFSFLVVSTTTAKTIEKNKKMYSLYIYKHQRKELR